MGKEILNIGKINQFENVQDFVAFANQNYMPLIEDLKEDERLDPKDRAMLEDMVTDFSSLLNELEKVCNN